MISDSHRPRLRRPVNLVLLSLVQLRSQQGAAQYAYEEAMTAVRLDPRASDAWRLAGEQATSLGRLPEVEQAMRRSIAPNLGDWRSQIDLGQLLIQGGRSAE